jgi:hypothetical protein
MVAVIAGALAPFMWIAVPAQPSGPLVLVVASYKWFSCALAAIDRSCWYCI